MAKGNPYRCKLCNNLASSDRFCKEHRNKVLGDQDFKWRPFRSQFQTDFEAMRFEDRKNWFPDEFEALTQGFLVERQFDE